MSCQMAKHLEFKKKKIKKETHNIHVTKSICPAGHLDANFIRFIKKLFKNFSSLYEKPFFTFLRMYLQ